MDYRAVREDLGTIADLRDLATTLRSRGISLTLDLVLNHVAAEHQWAVNARTGDRFYRDYFYLFADRELPDAYERSLPEVFPDFAPGNFTYDEESASWVWTTFNSWQWDLNWRNPEVFYEFADLILWLANLGRGVPAAGRDRVHLQADGHQLPEPARGARDHPGPAGGGPDRRPGADLQGRGDRRAGGPRPLPRGRQARRQGQRPGVPELADGADLVGPGGQGHAAVLRRTEPVPGQAADHGVGHLSALPRRHRLGDQRRGRGVGGAERVRASAVPRRLLRRALPDERRPRAGVPGEPGHRRPADQRHGRLA